MPDTRRSWLAWTIALAGGAGLWLATAALSGRTEAWDAPGYWSIAYPLSIALAAALGWWFPERTWRWGLSVMLVQAVVLMISASSFGLLPLGLMMFAVLALPAVWAAHLAARWRLRRQDR